MNAQQTNNGVVAVMQAAEERWALVHETHKANAMREARAAVAELIRTVDRVAYALTQDARTSDGITKDAAAKTLRAALARATGGAE